MIPNNLDKFFNSCQQFNRIMQGKAMSGYCQRHKTVVDANKQLERLVCPYYSFDLDRMVKTRKERFKSWRGLWRHFLFVLSKEDCWVERKRR